MVYAGGWRGRRRPSRRSPRSRPASTHAVGACTTRAGTRRSRSRACPAVCAILIHRGNTEEVTEAASCSAWPWAPCPWRSRGREPCAAQARGPVQWRRAPGVGMAARPARTRWQLAIADPAVIAPVAGRSLRPSVRVTHLGVSTSRGFRHCFSPVADGPDSENHAKREDRIWHALERPGCRRGATRSVLVAPDSTTRDFEP